MPIDILGLRLCRTIINPFIEFAIPKKKELIGVEIGVYKGKNALEILKNCSIKKLYLIDPYSDYDDGGNPTQNLGKIKIEAEKRLRKFKNIVWIYKSSDEAFKEIKEKLDFVYIDGNHIYEQVVRDINNYYPLVKNSAILGGDDFSYSGRMCGFGVIKAVIEFTIKNNLDLLVRGGAWWFHKGIKYKESQGDKEDEIYNN